MFSAKEKNSINFIDIVQKVFTGQDSELKPIPYQGNHLCTLTCTTGHVR